MTGGGDEEEAFVHERDRLESRIDRHAVEGEIGLTRFHRLDGVRSGARLDDVDGAPGESLLVERQDPQHEVLDAVGRCGDREPRSLTLSLGHRQVIEQPIQFCDRAVAELDERASGVGEADAHPGVTLKDRGAEHLLHVLHALRDRRLRQAEDPARLTERAGLRDRPRHQKLVERQPPQQLLPMRQVTLRHRRHPPFDVVAAGGAGVDVFLPSLGARMIASALKAGCGRSHRR